MASNYDFLAWSLAAWLAIMVVVLVARRESGVPGVGLDLSYLLSFFIIHWPGAFLYLLPWYYGKYDKRLVEAGFEQSILGVIAFAVGTLLMRFLLYRRNGPTQQATLAAAPPLNPRLPVIYLMMGLASYFLIFPISGRVRSLTALISNTNQLLVVGLALGCWLAWRTNNPTALRRWLLAIPLLPFLTLLTQGFLGYGVVAAVTTLTFVISFIRLRWWNIVLILLISYVSLSFYVTYMRDRAEIRAVIWGDEAVGARVETLSETLNDFEWFDPYNEYHLDLIDDRLNQNFLVGASVYVLAGGFRDYAHGQTLQQAALAIVPRALWPNKPLFGGSGDLVAYYTGLQFAEGTSVGVGQVMEFYINFGTVGVIIGFLLCGAVVGLVDLTAARRLQAGDGPGFLLWYLPGLGMLQPGGSLVEVTATVAGGIVAAMVINRLLRSLPWQPTPPDYAVLPPASVAQARQATSTLPLPHEP